MRYPDLFSAYPERHSSTWLRQVEPSDRKAFAGIGYHALMEAWGYDVAFAKFHQAGGIKRASIAQRNRKGQFKK